MLLRSETLDGIAAGKITLAFRRWKRALAKAGGRQRTRIGVLAIDDVALIEADSITMRDARAAGYSDPAMLRSDLDRFGEGDLSHQISPGWRRSAQGAPGQGAGSG